MTINQIIDSCRRLGESDAPSDVADLRELAEQALKLGEPLLAYDVLNAATRQHPMDLRLRQLRGLTLARVGAPESARILLEHIRDQGHEDEETLGLLARVYKDIGEQSANDALRNQWFTRSAEQYEAAYRAGAANWCGINAATLAACLDQPDRAARLATQVQRECLAKLEQDQDSSGQYWTLATLGEAALLLDEIERAAEWYGRATAQSDGNMGNLATTRRNAGLLCRQKKIDPRIIDIWLPLPRIVLFCGHMIDVPDRPSPRFPPELEPAVAAAIQNSLVELKAGIGFASAACGADILFLEAMLERGGEVNIILPHDKARFIADSVQIVPGGNWLARFERVICHDRARLSVASHSRVMDQSLAYEYANQFMLGLAAIRAWQLGTEVTPLALWDGLPGDGSGGTAWAIARWRTAGYDAAIIDLHEIFRCQMPGADCTEAQVAGVRSSPPEVARPTRKEFTTQMRALLFADVANFSKLPEEELPLFARHFLGAVADLADRSAHAPMLRNTWGDALYLVFESVTDAGLFALELRDLVAKTDWLKLGLSLQLRVRTALHYGPVYAFTNPVTGLADFMGTHVSRAARIEPVTPHGQVYASEVFAAIAFAERAEGFVCEYVGQIVLPKDYGTYPTYHVRRRGRSNPAAPTRQRTGRR